MSLIFFDTNILSYLVEEQLEETFFIFLKEQKLSACMTTSILLEMSKTNACDKRKKFLQFIQNDMFKKLRSDNDLECEEIINEVSRVFPKLYREKSNLITNVHKNREYFSKQLWQECVSQHEYLHRIAMQMLENEGMQTINVQKRNKKVFLNGISIKYN